LRWPSAGFRREPVGAGLAPPEAGLQPGSSFSLATAFRFLATRLPRASRGHSPLFLCYAVLMANTRSATLSIRLKSETKRRLARLAEASGRSSNFLISDAVESYVADQERMLAEMRQADRQVKSGHYVRHEDMKAWLLSWGTDRELPPPKCVCGKVHADESPRPRSRG